MHSDSYTDEECEMPVDTLLEQHTAAGGTRLDVVKRQNFDHETCYHLIYGTRCDSSRDLDGTVSRSRRRHVRLAELPAANSHEILLALAEYHGYALVPK